MPPTDTTLQHITGDPQEIHICIYCWDVIHPHHTATRRRDPSSGTPLYHHLGGNCPSGPLCNDDLATALCLDVAT